MGIFDKVVKDAEDMAQKDPNLAQQAKQQAGKMTGGQSGQSGADMQTAQNTIGPQPGSPDQDQNMGNQGQDPSMGQHPNTVDDQDAGQGDGDPNQDPNQGW